MSKYTFTCEQCDGSTITVTCEKDGLIDVIENFEFFLKGSGFHFNGTLDIVNEEEDDFPWPETRKQAPVMEDENSISVNLDEPMQWPFGGTDIPYYFNDDNMSVNQYEKIKDTDLTFTIK